MPATFSHFIQRAGRAARGRGRTGVAVLLVEKSAYNQNLVSHVPPSASSGNKNTKESRKKTTAAAESSNKSDPKATREYAMAHGVGRGGSQKQDTAPSGPQPQLNPESADEGLITFVQSTTCRRKIWASVFESALGGKCSESCYARTTFG